MASARSLADATESATMRAASRRRRRRQQEEIKWLSLPADAWENVIASTRRLITVFQCAAICRESRDGMRLLLSNDEGGLKGRELFTSYHTVSTPSGQIPTFQISNLYSISVPLPMALAVCQALKIRSLHILGCAEEDIQEATPPPAKGTCTLDREEDAPIIAQTNSVGSMWVPRLTVPEPTREQRVAADLNGTAVRRAAPTNQGSSLLSVACDRIKSSVKGMVLDLTTEVVPGWRRESKSTGGVAFDLVAGAKHTFLYGSFKDHPSLKIHEFIGNVPVTLLRPSNLHLASVMTCFLNKRLCGKDLKALPLTVFAGLPTNSPADMVVQYCRVACDGRQRKLSPAAVESNAKWLGATLRTFEQAGCKGWVTSSLGADAASRFISPWSMYADDANDSDNE